MVEPAGTVPDLVSILIVTFNSEKYLAACLDSIREQDYAALELIVVDNASSDRTREVLAASTMKAKVILNETNRGFAAGQNQATREARGAWFLCLNPDVLLAGDCITRLMEAAKLDERAGTICGKLLRWLPEAEAKRSKVIDSTGIYFLPNQRHLDRGAEQIDTGQYDRVEYVFGGTGAAALYRRQMVEAVSYKGEFFDEEFFSYREDADLAWRAQIIGWKCIYTPQAVAWHVRRVTPERRSELPHEINWHSVKNRFLMRAKNCSLWLRARLFFPILGRDLLILGYALFRDWRLLSALRYPISNMQRVLEKRRWVQAHRKVADRELLRWFSKKPASEPVLPNK